MTTKILTGTYSAGYALQSPITTLSIAASGYVEGMGVFTSPAATSSYAVINDGRIAGADTVTQGGVFLGHGGAVTNGSAADTKAQIRGFRGVQVANGAGLVTNFATIAGDLRSGVFLAYGGIVANGSATNTTADIRGATVGVAVGYGFAERLETVTNFGTIEATGATLGNAGVSFSAGGYGGGIGFLTNGSAGDRTALIQGYSGVESYTLGVMTNFGTIRGTGVQGGSGVYMSEGDLTNGSASDTVARVEGFTGVTVGFGVSVTVTNFGTIAGAGGVALRFSDYGRNTLVVEAGSAFVGSVLGAGNALDLGSGTGTLTGNLASGSVTVSGSMAPTTFSGFNAVEVGAGANFTVTGDVAIGAGQTLANAGVLALSGPVVNAGTISLGSIGPVASSAASLIVADATLSGGGTLSMGSALSYRLYGVAASSTLTNTDNTIVGSGFIGLGRLTLVNQAKGVINADAFGALVLNTGANVLTNAGLIEATSRGGLILQGTRVDGSGGGVIAAQTGSHVALVGATLIGGTLKSVGTGVIWTAVGSKDGLDGTTSTVHNQATLFISNASSLTLAGAIDNTALIGLGGQGGATRLVVAAAGAALSGGGRIILSNSAGNAVVGSGSASTFTNVDNLISGAGQIGGSGLTLVNQAKGMIVGSLPTALVIDTGANTIVNAGLIVAKGVGGVTIDSAVANSGVLEAAGGILTVNGAVSASGAGVIYSGTLDFASSFSQNVVFQKTTGVLELAQSQSYAGTVFGFSKTGGTSLDLRDIGFVNSTEATFSGTAMGGILTVTDGTHTAHITLRGDYRSSTFTASSDGHGGVIIVDPAASAAAHRFVAAAAGLGAGGGGLASAAQDTWRAPPAMLARPAVMIA